MLFKTVKKIVNYSEIRSSGMINLLIEKELRLLSLTVKKIYKITGVQ